VDRALRLIAIAGLTAACDFVGAWADEKREIPVAVLFVRHPSQPDTSGSSPPDGSEARPFPSLRAALAAAPAGALLRVDDGTYREAVVIRRPIVLLGRGAGRTRIIAPDGAAVALEVRGADRVQIHGVSIESGAVCALFSGGTNKLQKVEVRGCTEAGIVGRGAHIELVSSAISDIGGGRDGRGIDLDRGGLEARGVVLQAAGRRAVVLNGARGLLEDVVVRGSALSALQATAGADARVVRGSYEGLGGAALYAGASNLRVEGARVQRGEYAVLGFRGAELAVSGGELTDYRVAGVAMVGAHGTVENVTIARGGTDAAISVTRADGKTPVLLVANRISKPGTMGVHVTESAVTARDNTITGARLDAEKDMGDAFYAVDSRLVIEKNVMRGNAGSGVAAVRSQVRLSGNGFIENGRAGLLLLDASRGSVTGNNFERNQVAGVELGERSRATLDQNRFGGNVRLDIDVGCGRGLAGEAEIGEGNEARAGVLRQRTCAQ
jgi:parallel beta-helix repeat protein